MPGMRNRTPLLAGTLRRVWGVVYAGAGSSGIESWEAGIREVGIREVGAAAVALAATWPGSRGTSSTHRGRDLQPAEAGHRTR